MVSSYENNPKQYTTDSKGKEILIKEDHSLHPCIPNDCGQELITIIMIMIIIWSQSITVIYPFIGFPGTLSSSSIETLIAFSTRGLTVSLQTSEISAGYIMMFCIFTQCLMSTEFQDIHISLTKNTVCTSHLLVWKHWVSNSTIVGLCLLKGLCVITIESCSCTLFSHRRLRFTDLV